MSQAPKPKKPKSMKKETYPVFDILAKNIKKAVDLLDSMSEDIHQVNDTKLTTSYSELGDILNKFGRRKLTSSLEDLEDNIDDSKYLLNEIKSLAKKVAHQKLIFLLKKRLKHMIK